jgi:hypothetical protein
MATNLDVHMRWLASAPPPPLPRTAAAGLSVAESMGDVAGELSAWSVLQAFLASSSKAPSLPPPPPPRPPRPAVPPSVSQPPVRPPASADISDLELANLAMAVETESFGRSGMQSQPGKTQPDGAERDVPCDVAWDPHPRKRHCTSFSIVFCMRCAARGATGQPLVWVPWR